MVGTRKRKWTQDTRGSGVAGANHDNHAFIPEKNPLKIDVILEELFDFCSVGTLKNCRLVCKQWRDRSLKVWRKKAIIRLKATTRKSFMSMANYMRQCKNAAKNDSVVGKNKLIKLDYYPFRSFEMNDVYIKAKSNLRARRVILNQTSIFSDIFPEFLSTFPLVEDLELRNCTLGYSELHSNPNLQPWQTLKRLKICIDQPNQDSLAEERTTFFQRLIPILPNLQVLSLDPDEFNVLVAVKSTRLREGEDVKTLALKELEIINSRSRSTIVWVDSQYVVKPIFECHFPLQKLTLDLEFTYEIEMSKIFPSMHCLLHSLRESLQYLRTSFRFNIDHFINRIIGQRKDAKKRMALLKDALHKVPAPSIVLKKLKELRLANGIWGLYLLAHLQLPNVEKLSLEFGEYTSRDLSMSIQDYLVSQIEHRVFQKLETFELFNNHEIPGPAAITRFASLMPNLCSLSVPLDKQAFRTVCKKFTGLKTLNILAAECQYSKLDDESLTGVTLKGKKTVRPAQPSITDLKLLTDLHISRDAVFTEHAVKYGFLKLPRLHFLSVHLKQVSGEIKEKLLGHVTILRGERMKTRRKVLNRRSRSSHPDIVSSSDYD